MQEFNRNQHDKNPSKKFPPHLLFGAEPQLFRLLPLVESVTVCTHSTLIIIYKDCHWHIFGKYFIWRKNTYFFFILSLYKTFIWKCDAFLEIICICTFDRVALVECHEGLSSTFYTQWRQQKLSHNGRGGWILGWVNYIFCMVARCMVYEI